MSDWPITSASSDHGGCETGWNPAPALDFGSPATWDAATDGLLDVNPATGLPMIGGIGGIDAGGNAYGTSSTSSFDDFGSSFSAGIHEFHSSSDSFMSMDCSSFSSDSFSSFSSMGHDW